MLIDLLVNEFDLPGGGVPVKICQSNPSRAYVSIYAINVIGVCWVSLAGDGLATSAFSELGNEPNPHFRRHDYGELVTNEIWVSDGAEHGPQAHFIVTEGILT